MLALYQAFFTNHLGGLGAAVAAAKVNVLGQSSGWASLIQTYILFGDPATNLFPAASNAHALYLPLVRR